MDLSVKPLAENQGNITAVQNGPQSTSVPQVSKTVNSEKPNQLDPHALTLAKAIRQTESGGNFNAQGKSGEHGAYQFTDGTWNSASQKYLGHPIPLKEATLEQQNEVAYKRIADWKNKGYNPGQIASMWNAGEGEPNAYLGSFSNGVPAVGTNKYGVHYSVPDYAKKVATAYQTFKNQAPETFNPAPFSNPNPGEFDFTGQDNKPAIPNNGQSGVLADHILKKYSDNPLLNALGQTGEQLGNNLAGVGKSITGVLNETSKFGQGLMSKLVPGNTEIASLSSNITDPTEAQKPAFLGGQIGQFFTPTGAEEAAATMVPKAGKLVSLAVKGGVSGIRDYLLAKTQGQDNPGLVGGLSASMPFAGELLSKVAPVLKDFLGGSGTADALKIKKATPKLVEAWQKGTRGVNDLADTITQTVKNYETQGKTAFNEVINNLPDIKMPQNFIEGGIKKGVQDLIDSAPNLSDQEIKTLSNLQKYIERADVQGVKGIQNLRQGIDNAGFYREGINATEYKNSNNIISKVRKLLNDTSAYQADVYDKANKTNFAPQLKKALADASDRINFMNKFKANLIGTNPETYVERTVNKVKTLINRFGNPADYENTKEVLEEFEKRIGHPGLFSKDFQAANAAKNLKGLGGRITSSVLKKTGLPYIAGTGLLGGLLHHELNKDQ